MRRSLQPTTKVPLKQRRGRVYKLLNRGPKWARFKFCRREPFLQPPTQEQDGHIGGDAKPGKLQHQEGSSGVSVDRVHPFFLFYIQTLWDRSVYCLTPPTPPLTLPALVLDLHRLTSSRTFCKLSMAQHDPLQRCTGCCLRRIAALGSAPQRRRKARP